MTDKEKLDAILAEEAAASTENESNVKQQEPVAPANEASQYLNTMLNHNPVTGRSQEDDDADKKLAERKGLSKIGDEIGHKAEIRDGWIDVDKSLLGERATFYPEDWQFRVRPATVEAIRNWSMIDDENPLSVDDVFNEVLKSCIAIVTPEGPKPWGNICSWDRFFFLLLIREYTFKQGESEVAYEEDCPECDNPVKFTLTSQSLSYELPDPEVMPMYDRETRTWNIDPTEYDVEADVTTFYVPTLEKDANIKAWLIARYNENRNKKLDQVFMRFAPWMSQKISKDDTIAKRQMRELEMKYKSWDEEQFEFFNDVIKNIIVTPDRNLTTVCPVCGEEVVSQIRFPNNISALFKSTTQRRKKFGSKQ